MLVAIDVNQGDLLFQVPHGETPDFVRDHPQLQALDIPRTGQGGTGGAAVGLLITKTLVVVGDPQVTGPPGRARGAMLRAYDKQSGEEVGAVWMPAGQSGSPLSYAIEGRQYIVVAVSNREHPGEYIAYSLPQ
jgi:quinoprotein glucose dehydrogenase